MSALREGPGSARTGAMPSPLIGVLALQGDFEAHARALAEAGADAREVRTPEGLEGLDGLVLPGGESTTMTLGIEREGLAEPLRALVRGGDERPPSQRGAARILELLADRRNGRRTA